MAPVSVAGSVPPRSSASRRSLPGLAGALARLAGALAGLAGSLASLALPGLASEVLELGHAHDWCGLGRGGRGRRRRL